MDRLYQRGGMTKLIVRENLIALLSNAKRFPISILVAPAGSGKSTLLDQWQQANPDINIARLNIEETFGDIPSFLKSMVESIRSSIEIFSAPIINLLNYEVHASNNEIINDIVCVLKSCEDDLYLVIDNYHYIDGEQANDLLAGIIAQLPSNIHIILSSRHSPRLHLSRLKIEDKILQIGVRDLDFNTQQISDLCQLLTDDKLDNDTLNTIMKSTEGWVAGIKLSLMAFHQHGLSALKEFNGKHLDVVTYLATEVFNKLPERIQSFFQLSAILEKFDHNTCDYVLQREDSAAIMEKLVKHSMFIMPLPEHNGWYRYHALLSDFLRLQIKNSLSHKEICDLHMRSGRYFLNNHDYETALYHFKRADNEEITQHTLSTACSYWLKQGDFSKIIDHLGNFNDEALMANIDFSIKYIHALIFYRRFNQAQYNLDLLTNNLLNKKDIVPDTHQDIQFLSLCLNIFQHDGLSKENVNDYDLTHCHNNNPLRMFTLVFSAEHELRQGNVSKALNISLQAKTILSKLDYILAESYIDLIIALCDRHLGRGIEAINHMNTVYAKSTLIENSLPWININTGMVIVNYEQNKLTKAKDLCDLLLPKINHTCITEIISTIYLTLSRLLFIQGNKTKAARVLEQLERILNFGHYNRLTSQYIQESMRQAWMTGDINAAQALVTKHVLEPDVNELPNFKPQYCEISERRALATHYWYIFKGEYKKSARLLFALNAHLDNCDAISRSLVVKANLVMLDYYQGFESVAIQRLSALIKKYGLLKFSRTVFDEAPGLENVFLSAHNNKTIIIPKLFMNVFDDLFLQETSYSKPDKNKPLALTHKEQEVYLLMSSGLTNAQISLHVGTAVSTTKWHLKNIYGKLGVENRAQAILLQKIH